ncbi:MAG: hypothetical protein GY928_21280 [Colwellia sp.]|nr:hypothetical protein [Colwellia sp.]
MKLSKIKEFMDNHTSKRISCTIEKHDNEIKAYYIYMTPKGNKRLTKKYKSLEIDLEINKGSTILEWHKRQSPSVYGKFLKYINYYDRRELK